MIGHCTLQEPGLKNSRLRQCVTAENGYMICVICVLDEMKTVPSLLGMRQ